MSVRITQQQLESYLWGAAVLLRGTIDAGDYKQFIFPLLFFKRLCDVFDEETLAALKESGGDAAFAAYPENHRFQIPPAAHWAEVRKASKNVGQALQNAMRAIEKANPEKLFGIFGDAQWTNKDRLSDAMLHDLIEHFSTLQLSVANLPEDELGQGYEYLIKKFADDSGHTAAEFYTNRTVVHLMTEMLQPQPGESIYDPTCGSGGMLLSAVAHLRQKGLEWRNVRLYGQERNLMTSSIARMNCFLHGIEDFEIVRGDTLSEPKLVKGDRLMQFDMVLANPPYSIKQWDREAFATDPWGRNLYGTPPQGRADYAFWQHILLSLAPKTGRCAILFPHGVLFRQEESEMRRKMIEADIIECVIGLGPNLFYNSPMEACIVVCRADKPRNRRGQMLLINAVSAVSRERAQSFLTDEHIDRIVTTYRNFKSQTGFACLATVEDARKRGFSLNIPMYVAAPEQTWEGTGKDRLLSLAEPLADWIDCAATTHSAVNRILSEQIVTPAMPDSNMIAQRLPNWLDLTTWKRHAFGCFADSIGERVEPSDASEEIYVGLDDLEPGSLHLKRWGKGSDVVGTKLRFRKGDIIFGRRRAYQRKLVVAEAAGICSAHAMVVRAREELVLPEFLPFFMMREQFMNRAIEISVGSLSPTINWTSLKSEPFDLPPLDQQRRLARLLWATDLAILRNDELLSALSTARRALIDHLIPEPEGATPDTLFQRLDQVASMINGRPFPSDQYQSSGVKLIRPGNLGADGRLDWSPTATAYLPIEYVEENPGWLIESGQVLINLTAQSLEDGFIGRVVRTSSEDTGLLNQRIGKFVLSDGLIPEFFFRCLQTTRFRTLVENRCEGSKIRHLYFRHFEDFMIPVFSRAEQARVVEQLNDVDGCIEQIQQEKAQLAALQAALINLQIGTEARS